MTRSAGSYGLRPVWTASSPPDRNPGSKPVVLTASQPHAHWEVSNTQLSPAWPPPIVTAPGVCPPHRRSPPQHQGPAQTHPGQSKSLAHSRPCSGSTAQHKSTVPPQADGAQHDGRLVSLSRLLRPRWPPPSLTAGTGSQPRRLQAFLLQGHPLPGPSGTSWNTAPTPAPDPRRLRATEQTRGPACHSQSQLCPVPAMASSPPRPHGLSELEESDAESTRHRTAPRPPRGRTC